MKRSLAVGLVVAAIVAGGAAGWGATRVNHADKKASTKPPAIKIINYITRTSPLGITIDKESQVNRLTGTSTDFKQFVATNVQRINLETTCNAATGFTVEKYASNGYAIGGVNDCGGYAAIWGVRNGGWKELIGTQDMWQCADLKKYGVPKGLLNEPKCYNEATRKVVQYVG